MFKLLVFVFLIFACKQEDSNNSERLDKNQIVPPAATALTSEDTPPNGTETTQSTDPSNSQDTGDQGSQDTGDQGSQDTEDLGSQDTEDTNSQVTEDQDSQDSNNIKYYKDSDSDTYGDPETECTSSEGCVTDNTDCNDNNGGIFPGANEVCGDSIDQDCDGIDPNTLYDDLDKDSYGDPNGGTMEATEINCLLSTVSLNKLDCNDSDPNINPETSWYEDNDEDGLGSSTGNVIYTQCEDPSTDSRKFAPNNLDSDDNDFSIELYAMNSQGEVYQYNGSSFIQLSDDDDIFSNLSAGNDTVYTIDSDGYVYEYNGNSFTQLGGTFSEISAGNETVYTRNSDGSVYEYDGSSFDKLGTATFSSISAGNNTVYARNSDNMVYRYKASDSDFTKLTDDDDTSDRYSKISAGHDAFYTRDSDGYVYEYNGSSFDKLGNGTYSSISAGSDTVYARNVNGQVYMYTGETDNLFPQLTDGDSYEEISAGNDTVYTLDSSGNVFEYDGNSFVQLGDEDDLFESISAD